MTFKELFTKMGINMDGEVTENPTPSNPEPTPQPESAPSPSPSHSTENKPTTTSSTVEQPDITAQLAAKEKEIEQLKAANLALLQHTPVPENNTDSVEDMIYRCVMGKPNNSNE